MKTDYTNKYGQIFMSDDKVKIIVEKVNDKYVCTEVTIKETGIIYEHKKFTDKYTKLLNS